jgi:leucine dehydrogenase
MEFMFSSNSEPQVYLKHDPATQLLAIIAIHSMKRGVALGGCRWLEYSSFEEALTDARGLAKAMSYKAALSSLPHGGGKAVLYKPKHIPDKNAYLKSFSDFINSLNGDYVTTIDSGMQVSDLDFIAQHTSFITGHTQPDGSTGDPSPATASGVIYGMEAAAKFKLDRSSLEGLHVAIQGLGNVGYSLVKELYKRGAKITVCDTDKEKIQYCVDEFSVNYVEPDKIYQTPCDIFSPCALGSGLNSKTIPLLNTYIIAGSANTQLGTSADGVALAKRDILYAPDYVINAGGLIAVAGQYARNSKDLISSQIEAIYTRLWEIFASAKTNNLSTNIIADKMAQKILND